MNCISLLCGCGCERTAPKNGMKPLNAHLSLNNWREGIEVCLRYPATPGHGLGEAIPLSRGVWPSCCSLQPAATLNARKVDVQFRGQEESDLKPDMPIVSQNNINTAMAKYQQWSWSAPSNKGMKRRFRHAQRHVAVSKIYGQGSRRKVWAF